MYVYVLAIEIWGPKYVSIANSAKGTIQNVPQS